MAKILVLLADGFEEIETVVPTDIFRRAGFEVVLASLTGRLQVTGGHEITLKADRLISDCNSDDFDVLMLPGGNPGVSNLLQIPSVISILKHFHAKKKWIAAICAAPLVLQKAGILTQHTITSFPGVKSDLVDIYNYKEETVVVDGKLITSRGAGTAEQFAFSVVEQLSGKKAAEKLSNSMVCRPANVPE